MGKPWENGVLMGFYGIYPLEMTHLGKMAIELVGFPIKHGDVP